MPRFDVVALFPELIQPVLQHGVARRAPELGSFEVHWWPLREHAEGSYRRVDDRPFGGGPGMVMLAEPLARAVGAARAARRLANAEPEGRPVPVLSFTPAGRPLDQALVEQLAGGSGAILVCARYEGVDQRFIDTEVDLEVSLGDFVISGGELAAAVLLDAVARLQPGVLHDPESHQQDSFAGGLLEGPRYTRPERWSSRLGARPVPAVLLSGDHARIARWHREQSLRLTAQRRPDLIERLRASGGLDATDEAFLRSLGTSEGGIERYTSRF
jgi:tRNA (guanine37-N1)-methyltransferase